MATYTLANLQTDIRNYTEVGSTVLSDTVLERIIKNAEHTIFRAVDVDDERFYSTSNCIIGNRYVSVPADCRVIRYVQLLNDNVSPNVQVFLEQRDTSFMAEYYDTPSTSSTSLPKGSIILRKSLSECIITSLSDDVIQSITNP